VGGCSAVAIRQRDRSHPVLAMPDLASLLRKIDESPGTRLESFTALALDQVISGFRAADKSCARLMQDLHRRMASDRLGEMSPLVRIYLDHKIAEDGARVALALLRSAVQEVVRPPVPSPMVGQHCVSVLVEAIEGGRAATFLSEGTLVCLFHFVVGYLQALEQFDAEHAARQQEELAGFERWLGEQYGEPDVAWYRLLALYEGGGSGGLDVFVKRWRAWKSEIPSAPGGPSA
jgi:hypothetical protein